MEGDGRRHPPAASVAARTARWPRWTPSNVPIATARGLRSSSPASGRPSSRPLEREHRPPDRLGDAARASSAAEPALPRRGPAARVGLVDPERPDRRAAQGRAVPAERLRDRPHVRPRADSQLESDAVPYRRDLERVDPDRRSGISTTTPRRASLYARRRRSSPPRSPGSAARPRRGGPRVRRRARRATAAGGARPLASGSPVEVVAVRSSP